MGMRRKNKKIIAFLIIAGLVVPFFWAGFPVFNAARAQDLQSQIDNANEQMVILNKKIADYQKQIKQAGAEKNTLQSAIKILNLKQGQTAAQIDETKLQLAVTQLQAEALNRQIETAQTNVTNGKSQIADLLNTLYQTGNKSALAQLLSAKNLSDFVQSLNNILSLEKAFGEKVTDLQKAKTALAERQTAGQQKQQDLSDQNKQLADQQRSLSATTDAKNQLLTVTKNKESNYQKLLARARAALQSYATFVQNAGGAGILGNETVCDAWGCYYNQRDAAWGRKALDGTGYTLASDGCLVTAMAMVMTHYGYRNVTPITINANSNNFASYAPAYLLYTISVDGVSATRVTTTIDQTLAQGTPVIVELSVYGGTHFVVLVSGSNGNYIMRDPYVANGKDISFTSHYKVREIISIEKVVISG